MQKKIVVLFFIFMLAQLSGFSNLMFEKANQAYNNQNFDEAQNLYEQLIGEGYCHPDIYFNLGNAYYKKNKLGLAVWCYKKAVLKDASEKDFENYFFAKSKIAQPIPLQDKVFFIRWWEDYIQFFSVNQWAFLALLFFLIPMVFLILKKIKNNVIEKRMYFKISFLLSLLFLCSMFLKLFYENYRYEAVVILNNSSFKKNATDSKTSNIISEGIEVRVLEKLFSKSNESVLWKKVELPNGEIGWMNSNVLKKI